VDGVRRSLHRLPCFIAASTIRPRDLEAPLRRILIVDDDEDILQLMSFVLQDEGYAVECARDGWAALHQISSSTLDLVLLDLMMPGLDGWGVLARLERVPHPPVVVVSARPDPARALRAGAKGCISKPFLPGELVSTCQQTLGAP